MALAIAFLGTIPYFPVLFACGVAGMDKYAASRCRLHAAALPARALSILLKRNCQS